MIKKNDSVYIWNSPGKNEINYAHTVPEKQLHKNKGS